jgi:hypothetical protein
MLRWPTPANLEQNHPRITRIAQMMYCFRKPYLSNLSHL